MQKKKKAASSATPLTNQDLMRYARELGLRLRGVYMRDKLPSRPLKHEMAVVNLDDTTGRGTHWVCYRKQNNIVSYFDSFGNLRPPDELRKYFGPGTHVRYNYKTYQRPDTVICGHLCLLFLVAEEKKRRNRKRRRRRN